MFRISLQSLGTDMVTKDVTAHVDTSDEALVFAEQVISEILGYANFYLRSITLNSYSVTREGTRVGSFSITKLH